MPWLTFFFNLLRIFGNVCTMQFANKKEFTITKKIKKPMGIDFF
jgi:hypothetical protein